MELTCVQCENTFEHSLRDQEFFKEKGWGDLLFVQIDTITFSATAATTKTTTKRTSGTGSTASSPKTDRCLIISAPIAANLRHTKC